MTFEAKKGVTVLMIGVALYWLAKDSRLFAGKKAAKRKKLAIPDAPPGELAGNPMAKNAYIAMKAFSDAFNAGEPSSVLDQLNRNFTSKLGVKVFKRGSDGNYVVSDLKGNVVFVNHFV